MQTNNDAVVAAIEPKGPPVVTLSDGRKVTFPHKPKGRHVIKAATIAGGQGQTAVFAAIVAQLAVVELGDGKTGGLTYEELEDMEIVDFLALLGEVVGNLSPGLATLLA